MAHSAGIFVGGASRRMGGHPKGLLRRPDTGERLVERLVRVARDAGLAVALVGDTGQYAGLLTDVPRVPDRPCGVGPLGGLGGLLHWADGQPTVALACDMPDVSADAVRALAADPTRAAVLACRRNPEGPWEPFLARYDPVRVLPALDAAIGSGVRSFQQLLGRVDVALWAGGVAWQDCLADWDAPDDIPPAVRVR